MITECHTELLFFVFFSSRRRHTRYWHDWSSDVCSSDLGGWIDIASAGKELCPCHLRHPLVGEHECHVLTCCLALAQPPHTPLGRALAHDSIVFAVALAEFAFDPLEVFRVVLYDQQHRLVHIRFLDAHVTSTLAADSHGSHDK